MIDSGVLNKLLEISMVISNLPSLSTLPALTLTLGPAVTLILGATSAFTTGSIFALTVITAAVPVAILYLGLSVLRSLVLSVALSADEAVKVSACSFFVRFTSLLTVTPAKVATPSLVCLVPATLK